MNLFSGCTSFPRLSAGSSCAATLIGLAAALVPAAPAGALTITQNATYNIPGATSTTLNFNQFDASLGTLTAVNFLYNGKSSGSFTITNNRGSTYTLTSFSEIPAFTWGGDTGPDPISISADLLPGVLPALGSRTVAPNGGAKTFTLASAPTSSGSTSYNGFFSYFTGNATTSLLVESGWSYNTSTNVSLDASNLAYAGTVTLEYVYEPTPVPAPLPALGAAAGYGFLRRQRRRLNATK